MLFENCYRLLTLVHRTVVTNKQTHTRKRKRERERNKVGRDKETEGDINIQRSILFLCTATRILTEIMIIYNEYFYRAAIE